MEYVYSVPLKANTVLHKLVKIVSADQPLDLAVGEVVEIHDVAITVCRSRLDIFSYGEENSLKHCSACFDESYLDERSRYRDRAVGTKGQVKMGELRSWLKGNRD